MIKNNKIILNILIICFILISTQNKAKAETFDINKLSNVTINYEIENEKYQNKKISLYQVAELNENTEFIALEKYKDYNIDFSNTNDIEEWNKTISETISGIIKNEQITPDAIENTNEEGKVTFKELKPGMYLIETETTYERYKITIYNPFLVSVPNATGEYEVNISPKGTIEIPQYEEKEYKIIKYWDDGNEKSRPEKIEVNLFRDGNKEKTVTLSKENNWTYTWQALDDGSIWSVMEENVPSNYKVSLENDRYNFYITNKLIKTSETTIKNPKTGESIAIFVFIATAIISILGLIITTLINRRLEDK